MWLRAAEAELIRGQQGIGEEGGKIRRGGQPWRRGSKRARKAGRERGGGGFTQGIFQLRTAPRT